MPRTFPATTLVAIGVAHLLGCESKPQSSASASVSQTPPATSSSPPPPLAAIPTPPKGPSEYELRQLAEASAAKRKSQARTYANHAGRNVMSAVGGGQDLVVTVKDWEYDSHAGEYIIKLDIQFNGAFIRSNVYQVGGVLTVNENGTDPKLARTSANDNFKNIEYQLKWVAGAAAGVIVLGSLSD